ncbi:hypothetical protein [Limosilactobacillus mucosae]|uniref:Uncharacterized protein n=1 Tax=Limosilactobacillus mucosae TaxID=97478 RepID=A0AAJ1HSZ3_LIMMU|nr:hypothetical protein [Limosilactobacillus mucosae]MDC2828962.1 hypothetical protein [Limosilactobacillus mucosae]
MSSLEQLFKMPLVMGFSHPTYGEHKKHCLFGCELCNDRRFFEKLILKKEKQSISGLNSVEVEKYRKMNDHDDNIRYWYPNRREALDGKGNIILDCYFFLKAHNFNDNDIKRYFRINSDNFQIWKKENCPNWKQSSQYDEPMAAAMSRYKNNHDHTTAHRN